VWDAIPSVAGDWDVPGVGPIRRIEEHLIPSLFASLSVGLYGVEGALRAGTAQIRRNCDRRQSITNVVFSDQPNLMRLIPKKRKRSGRLGRFFSHDPPSTFLMAVISRLSPEDCDCGTRVAPGSTAILPMFIEEFSASQFWRGDSKREISGWARSAEANCATIEIEANSRLVHSTQLAFRVPLSSV
jgi:hypothetical protein